MSGPIEIACLQTRPMAGMQAAIAHSLDLAREAAADGARMLFLPEYCAGLAIAGGRLAPPAAAAGAHPAFLAFGAFARAQNVWMVVGSVAVDGPDGKLFNRGAVFDAAGRRRSTYDKIHMFDVRLSEREIYRESDVVAPGAALSLTETPAGVLGHTICYDLRFPRLYRDLAQAGAEILAIPAAFTRTTGPAHWHALCRARAIETGAWVVAPGAVGPIAGGGGAYGHSLVVDPWGEILVDGGDAAGVIRARIDPQAARDARARIPSLTHDRPWAAPGKVAAE